MGLTPWYGHENQGNTTDIQSSRSKRADKVMEKTGLYIGAVFSDTKTIYKKERWCPEWWEITKEISGMCNPEYTDTEQYKDAVLNVLSMVQKDMKQTTTQVAFEEIDFFYFKNEPNKPTE